jgi:hypothetical protein
VSRGYPEHNLQVQIRKWVEACVMPPKFFEAVDRGKAAGKATHLFQKRRGAVAGTPDTRLMIPGLPIITIELKAPNGRPPSEQQRRVGAAIAEAGGIWGWTRTVGGYAALCEKAKVPLYGNYVWYAQHLDALLQSSAIKKKESRSGRPDRSRYPPSKAKLRRIERLRAQGIEV